MTRPAIPATGSGASPPGWWPVLGGVVAGAAALVAGELVATVLVPAGAPVAAVGGAVIDALPASLVNWGKETLGTADKPVLLGIVVLVVLALAGWAGASEVRRDGAGSLVLAGLATVAGVAAAVRAESLVAALPAAVAGVAGVVLLRALTRRLRAGGAGARAPAPRPGAEAVPGVPGLPIAPVVPASGSGPAGAARRSFLVWTSATAALTMIGAVALRAWGAAASVVEQTRALLTLPAPATTESVPAGAELGVDGLSSYRTPNATFYRIDTALRVPVVDADTWTLRITGLVEQEVTVTFAELLAMPLVEHTATLACVSNPVGGDLVGNATWLGLPIRELLARAGPLPGADMVLSTSEDGWTAGTPLEALTDPDREALLAVGMNGEPLPVEHGFPVRMVVPGLYGYVSATKWVRELRVTTFAADQKYWTPLGWAALGPVKTASRIDVPKRGSDVSAGPVVIAGVAWDQHTGIDRVEVGIDGEWRDAELAEVTGPDTWRQWRLDWAATSGRHEIAVRATNSDGETQTSDIASPAPDGATGWHTVVLEVS